MVSIDCETPADKLEVMKSFPVKLADRSSLVDLLSSLRGAEAALRQETGPDSAGRILGIESSLDSTDQPPVVLLQQGEKVSIFPVHPSRFSQHLCTLHQKRAGQGLLARSQAISWLLNGEHSHSAHHLTSCGILVWLRLSSNNGVTARTSKVQLHPVLSTSHGKVEAEVTVCTIARI